MAGQIESVADRLSAELARASQAIGEDTRRHIAALDDRYRDLPARVPLLERDLDQHRLDTTLHRRTPTRRKPS